MHTHSTFITNGCMRQQPAMGGQDSVSKKLPIMREIQHPQKHGTSPGRFRCLATLLTLCLLTVLNTPIAYAGGDTQTITINVQNAPLDKVFSEIEKQTHYSFLYMQSLIQKAKHVTVKINNASLEKVLEICFKDQPQLTYSIMDKVVVVKPKEKRVSEVEGAAQAEQDPIDISGKVFDDQGNPLVGANVKVKGSSQGVTTDIDGKFTLKNVPENAILEISYVGHEVQLVSVKGQKSLMVSLQPSKSSLLDETVVIAYGTTTKRLATGNVASVKASDIEKQPVNNPLLALQGRVPGLIVTQANGLPGSGITVRVQGRTSIIKGSDPLIVIDGVPYSPQLLSTTLGGPLGSSGGPIIGGIPSGDGNSLSYINPADIESIDILKDADATAIYGSRAANGAILITTKKGKQGKTKFDINLQKGWGQVSRKLNLLNTQQYLQMRREGFKNDGITNIPAINYDLKFWDTTKYTDWQKVLIGGTAHYTNIYTSISGGNNGTQYLLGATYHKETTVFPGDFADKKGALHFSINSVSPNQKFRLQFSGNYLVDNNLLMYTDRTNYAVRLAPNSPSLYNEDGSLNWAPNASGTSTFINPLASLLFKTYRNKATNLVSNVVLSYQILSKLEIKSSFGYTNLETNEFAPNPLNAVSPENRPFTQRDAYYTDNVIRSWIIEPQLNYTELIGNGKLNALLGATIQQNNNSGQRQYGIGYSTDEVMENIISASSSYVLSAIQSMYKYNAIFGRLNYNLQDRYILNLNARRDGSSRFGSKNRFHNFGSIGISWIFSNENFIGKTLPFISFGKFRASYGTSGNDQIGEYQFLNLYSPITASIPYQNSSSLDVNGLPNPYVQWEETKKLQFGLDLGLLKDRVLFSINYVHNRSSNQLLPYALPIITGANSLTQNFPATIQNTAWELTLNTINIKGKEFAWKSNVNLTIPKNKLIDFPNLETSTYSSAFIIGQPINIIKAFHFLGVDQASGAYKFESKTNPNAPVFSDDATVLINTNPKFYGGFENNISFKGIQLDFLFQFVKQTGFNYLYDLNSGVPGRFNGGFSNQRVDVLNRWQKTGDIASIQRFTSRSSLNSSLSNAGSSDAAYSDASYLRLKNLSLSWQLPEKWIHKSHLQNCRFYLQGQNLLTFTNYKGLDPETQSLSSLPPLRLITVGIQVGL